jgi:hypothetical protein
VAVLLFVGTSGVMAQTTAPVPDGLRLVLVVHNHANVPHAELRQALAVAERLYHPVGGRLDWMNPEAFAHEQRAAALARRPQAVSLVHVGLLTGPGSDRTGPRTGVLGVASARSRWAYVFHDRIGEYLRRHPRSGRADLLLGYVIAHEVGHVLLADNYHPATGLMALLLNHGGIDGRTLTFSKDEVARIRVRISSDAAPATSAPLLDTK